MMRSLNRQQQEAVLFHRKWCKDAIIALKKGNPMPQYMVFLSGPGGVGKSHVIKLVHFETMHLLRPLSHHFEPEELPLLLTAFTGTAAFGIEGMTIHSALGLNAGPAAKRQYQPAGSEKLNTLRSRLGKLGLIVIDESSMVGSDLLYHIHRRLEDIMGKNDSDSRFGGVSILAVGDLFQLQPVQQKYIFDSPSDSYAKLHGSLWEESFQLIELTESMRQRGDQLFADILMRIRTGTHTPADLVILQSRVVSRSDPEYPADAMHVFRTNQQVDSHNKNRLAQLNTHVFKIKAIDKKKDVKTGMVDVQISTKPSDTGGLREEVSVAVGARVMITVNIDVSDGLANGVCGTVTDIDHTDDNVHVILVKFDSERVGIKAASVSQYRRSHPGSIPIKRIDVQFFVGNGRASLEAKRTQFPLTLSWGSTIHKVQGKTMDKIVVSMEDKGGFRPGQAYVAFSRVKTLQGLYLLGFDAKSIKVSPAVNKEMERLRGKLVPSIITEPSYHEETLNVQLLNVRSCVEHYEDIKADSKLYQADILCLQETFLKLGQQHAIETLFPACWSERADRPVSLGERGGLLTVVKENLRPRRFYISVGSFEILALSIVKHAVKVNIVSVYRAPSLPLRFPRKHEKSDCKIA